jgi:nicotinamide riboside kinase
LGRRLAAELGLPFIPEGMREYLESGGPDLHSLGHAGVRKLVLRLWDERLEAEERHPAFIADRSTYDFAAFWLYYHHAQVGDPDTDRLMALARRRDRYDLVALLPLGAIPFVADGIRSSDPWAQLHSHLLIEGMVRMCAPNVLTITTIALDDRVAEVRAALG